MATSYTRAPKFKKVLAGIQAFLLMASIVTMAVPSGVFAQSAGAGLAPTPVASNLPDPLTTDPSTEPEIVEPPATPEAIESAPTEVQEGDTTVVDGEIINPENTFTPPKPGPEVVQSCTVVSDETTEINSDYSTATWVHPNWTKLLNASGAKWLWKSYFVDTSLVPDTTTFTKHIVLNGTPTSATLEIAADNTYTVLVNGVAPSCDGSQEDNFSAPDVCAITLHSGDNKLIFTVTNTAGDSDPEANPAGLQYKVSIVGTTCQAETIPLPPVPKANTATIYAMKIVCEDPNDLPRWGAGGHPIIWNTATSFLATHPGCHTQGDWGFEWADQNGANAGDSYIGHADGYTPFPLLTHNNGKATAVVPLDGVSEIHLREVLKDGYIPFSSTATASAEFYCDKDALNYDNWDFIRNPVAGGKYWCVAFNAKTPAVEPPGDTDTTSTVVVHLADLANNMGDVLADATKWFFYDDNSNAINNSLGSFVDGPALAPVGVGSAQITLDAVNTRTNLATNGFAGTKLSDIKTLSYDSYSHIGVSGPTESPYLVMNVSFDGNDTWQRRLVYVPVANNPVVPQDAWNTNDAIKTAGSAIWTWSGYAKGPDGKTSTDTGGVATDDLDNNTWPDGNTNEFRTWSEINAAFPAAKILPTGGLVGIRVGEPGPATYTGNIDKFVIGIKSGTNTQTTTYDFESTEASDNGDGGSSGGTTSTSGGSGGGGGNPSGSVLGVSTSAPEGQVLGASCTILLNDYLRLGYKNNAEEVSKLQQFLNDHMQSNLPVTGFFGPMTDKAVRVFQLGYKSDVLAPWVPLGFMPTDSTTTGYVYKTTQWKINMIHCPDLNLPFPQLP